MRKPANRRWTPRECMDRDHPPAQRREAVKLALLAGTIQRLK